MNVVEKHGKWGKGHLNRMKKFMKQGYCLQEAHQYALRKSSHKH